ncbi:MAG: hypothetical protein ABIP97_11550 [Chthoniobacterales bacterium]
MENEAEDEVVVQDELEMVIPTIQSPDDENKIITLLRTIPGVDALAVNAQIVWLTFRPNRTSLNAILDALKRHNFYPSDALENGHLLVC